MRWKRRLKIGLPLLLVLGLAWNCMHDKRRNYEVAAVTHVGALYRVELKGVRYLMVHDPISALMAPTYEESYEFELPRIEGVVKGEEIPRPHGWYKLLGTVTFAGERMTVDLYYDNTDDKTQPPLSWNGDYVVHMADGAALLPAQ